MDTMQAVFEAMAITPDAEFASLSLVPPEEQDTLLRAFQGEMCPEVLEAPFVIHQFEALAGKLPEAECLVYEGEFMTYGEVNAAANRMARVLRKLGVSTGSTVALWVDRGLSLVISMLAVLKAQGAFVPCDPSYPPERLAMYIEDSNAAVVVTQGANLEAAVSKAASLPKKPHVLDLAKLPELAKNESGENLGLQADSNDLA